MHKDKTNGHRAGVRHLIPVVAMALLFLFAIPCHGSAETRGPVDNFLPASGFSDGWSLSGKISRYNPGNLYTYINGEAELFLPYGFEALASAFYTRGDNPASGIVADIYRMGSRIDAFGIYSNYRDPGTEKAKLGVEGFVEDSQLMFYKDRYFIRLSVSGTVAGARDILKMFAREIDRKLAGTSSPPGEVALIGIPGVNTDTIRYVARSLLGYAFFPAGLTADIAINGETAKIFVVMSGSIDKSRAAFRSYVEYLERSGNRIDPASAGDGTLLMVNDPLYKGTYVRRSGPYIIGVTRLKDPLKAVPVVDRLASGISTKNIIPAEK
jgi:hypothetical protein